MDLTLSLMASKFSPLLLTMLSETDSIPSRRDLLVTSLNPKTTLPRSLTRTGTLLGAEISASLIPSGVTNSPGTRIRYFVGPIVTVPPGKFVFSLLMEVLTWFKSRL